MFWPPPRLYSAAFGPQTTANRTSNPRSNASVQLCFPVCQVPIGLHKKLHCTCRRSSLQHAIRQKYAPIGKLRHCTHTVGLYIPLLLTAAIRVTVDRVPRTDGQHINCDSQSASSPTNAEAFFNMSSGDKSVYLGFWTNWSQGATAGLTYTTTLDNGAFFIAFLALFVTFTGTCFWSIVSFIIHQIFSRQAPQNAIYHQQQAILRTSDTSSAALWRLITLSWAWRKVSCAASLKSTFIPLVASLATFSAFTIAGIFSSRVASSRDGEVLINGHNCATVNLTLMASATDNTAEYYGAGRLRSSFNYKSVCYPNSGSTDSCRTFARSSLPYTVTHGTPCPFPGGDRICLSNNGSIRLDSGFLNSHHDLGINAPPSSRYLYRTVAECSPLRDEDYVRYNETNSSKTLQFLYGNSAVGCGHRDGCTVEVGASRRSGNLLGLNQYTVSYVLRFH